MGVLTCDRLGCDNIMCDYFSFKYGYICNECLEELKRKPGVSIESFMNTLKDECEDIDTETWEEAINIIFQTI